MLTHDKQKSAQTQGKTNHTRARSIKTSLPSNLDVASLQQSIRTLVEADLTLSTQLLSDLKNERLALQERRAEDLVSLLKKKTETLNSIDKNSEERQKILTNAGIEVTDKQWTSFIESLNDKKLSASWQALLKILSQCRHANTINGKMVARGQQTLGRLLSILRGQITIPELYDHHGAATNATGSQTCIKI